MKGSGRLLVLAAAALVPAACCAADVVPFRPGEKLHYTVSWAGIPAAEATLEILPREKRRGKKAWHFVMTARTSALVEHIYPVHDRIDSFADAAMTRSLLYRERKRTRGKRKNVTVAFDWKAKTARYTKNGKARKPRPLSDGAFDPLAVFYYFRMQELREGAVLTRPVSDGKKCVTGTAGVRGRQRITAGGKQYDTFLVEPELTDIGGVFEKSPGAKLQIWVTADRRRLPVLIKSRVIVGSFTAELDAITLP